MKDDIDELIRLIDSSMENGAGHVNIEINEDSTDTKVKTSHSVCGKNMACSIPTLHEGIDDK